LVEPPETAALACMHQSHNIVSWIRVGDLLLKHN
jgi:hypothetical protein